jgi:nucleoside-diphosphate-sugar epimerase
MVYGDFSAEPQPEDGPLRPVEPYGRLKLAAELTLAALAPAAGVPLVVVRPSAVYGPGDANGRVVQRAVEAAADGARFVLTAPPGTRLDFTHVEDVAAGLHAAALADEAPGRTYNLTAGAAHPLARVLDACPGLVWETGPRDPFRRPQRGTLDTRRARTDLGWAPARSLSEGVRDYAAFARRLAAGTLAAPAPVGA